MHIDIEYQSRVSSVTVTYTKTNNKSRTGGQSGGTSNVPSVQLKRILIQFDCGLILSWFQRHQFHGHDS